MSGGTEVAASRLETALRGRAEGRIHLVPYLMAGFPDERASIELGRTYARAGAAAIEVGIPFSDPMADGPVVQIADQAALEAGMTVGGAIRVAGEVAAEGPPVVLMTYFNPVLAYGVERFAADAASAGVAGVIVPDVPAEESEGMAGPMHDAGLDTVFLVAPTSPDDRITRICEASSGFVYCVTLTGVTGARSELDPGLQGLLGRIAERSRVPVAAGFGISTADHIQRLRGHADAAVVASALLREVEARRDPRPLLEELVQACR
jgi:tryptophan synthase alpha chain